MFIPGGLWVMGLTLSMGQVVPGEAAKTEPGRRPGEAQPASVDAAAVATLHPALLRLLDETTEPVKAWVFFRDKGIASQGEYEEAVRRVASTYNLRAKQRRQMRGSRARRGEALFDERDLPVAAAYVDAVAATGARIHVTSRWVNAVSVYATRGQLEQIARLACVAKLQPVARAARIAPPLPEEAEDQRPSRHREGTSARSLDYGASEAQLAQINLITLHEAGYTGDGVIVGILDTGFRRSHEAFNHPLRPLNVIAEYDFVDDDPNTDIESGDPSGQHGHGTMILGCLGAYMPGELVGGAYGASFVLAKTEDMTDEYPAEEDNFVAGLEFIEANGADMSTSSLGYIDWYTQADLDGLTAVTTIAVNLLTSHGVHHCNAAGNDYHDSDPGTSSLIAPSDGFDVLTCGAVDSLGEIASFSSDGPTADGRVKPEVLARGVGTHTVSSNTDDSYTTANGTSLSTPLVACAVACLVQARPYWTVERMRERLFETADYYAAHGTYDPYYVRGYGIIDAYAAYDACSDAGIVVLDRDKYACESTATVTIVDCGLNADDGMVESVIVAMDSDSETGIEQVTLTETDAASAEFVGSIDLRTTDSPGVLLVAEGDGVTVTYVDADDGAGGINVEVTDGATVDCQSPNISNVHTAAVEAGWATVGFDADEPVCGTVYYGESCDALGETAAGGKYSTAPTVHLAGLSDDTTYFYTVEAVDEAGNTTADDNGGDCYTFSTLDIPDYFTEFFEVSGNDLDNLLLRFTPDGSPDFYEGCARPIMELPTSPSGGTILTLSDDESESITLSDGATVSLYGIEYGTFFVGSNGYVTFGAGDATFFESPGAHFDLPRISALFDDLDPSSGGAVSWKQLSDRVAVTWQNVPEVGSGAGNTFQIEMFFEGSLVISYLSIAADDGLAGLSAGTGLAPDFSETDLSGLGTCRPKAPLPAALPHDVSKNRYTSFAPSNGIDRVAFRVELSASWYFPGSVGVLGWVTAPDTNGVARVGPDSVYRMWREPAVHIGDCEIAPVATYHLRAIAEGAAETDERNYSDPLPVDTAGKPGSNYWADCVGPLQMVCSGDRVTPCVEAADCPPGETCGVYAEPDGYTNFVDIGAAVKAFQKVPGTVWPDTLCVDIHGNEFGDAVIDPPNYVVNFSDVQQMVLAFKGNPYPFSDPGACP